MNFVLLLFMSLVPFSLSVTAQLIVKLEPETNSAFDALAKKAEAGIEQRVNGTSPFLWLDEAPDRKKRARSGEVLVERFGPKGGKPLPDGIGHHWLGAVFIPGGTAAKTMHVISDYNELKGLYPNVTASRLISRDGNRYMGYLRFTLKKVFTIVLDTEHEHVFHQLTPKRIHTVSRSTKIVEIDDGKPLPVGEGHGFMWRINAYWRIEEVDDGVFVECQSLTMTRDIPPMIGWAARPFVEEIPRESLEATLASTRQAVMRK